MPGRILILIVWLCAVGIHAQQVNPDNNRKNPLEASRSSSDDLVKHFTAAESHQISGDLVNAAIENRAVLGIAL